KYVQVNKHHPDDFLYHSFPFGQNYFPAPVIGYSCVKVYNVPREDVTINATGYSVYEFFTTKDFPTKTQRTALYPTIFKQVPQAISVTADKYHYAASQGFIVRINDMNGKPKSTRMFDEYGNEVSSAEYNYSNVD